MMDPAKATQNPWPKYHKIFLFICVMWLIGTLTMGMDLLTLDDHYTRSGKLEKIYFQVRKRHNDTLLLTVDSKEYEVFTGSYDENLILEGILRQCDIALRYDPNHVGETVAATIDSDLLLDAQILSTTQGDLILGLEFDGVEYSDFDTAHTAWKGRCMASAAAFPVVVVILLIGNRFFKSKKQE